MTCKTGAQQGGIRIACQGADLLPLDAIEDFQGGLKKRGKREIELIIKSIENYGFSFPFFVWNGTGHNYCLDGHGRIQALAEMRRRGESLPMFPVVYVDAADEAEAKQKLLRLNSQYGAMTKASVIEFAGDIVVDWGDLILPNGQLVIRDGADVVGDDGPQTDVAEELCEKWGVQPGDLWLLGNHRLLCGDATSGGDVARVMGAEKAEMVFTDPPWNVAIGQDSNPRHRQRAGLCNDNLSQDGFEKFLSAFAEHMATYCKGDIYVVLGASEWPTLDVALRENGYKWSATIIWVKDLFVLGRSKYHRRYEPIWYGWHKSCKSSFCDARDLDDVWEIKRPRRSEEHPTMKPVELVARAIQNSSKNGGVVYEPFSGSGTTIIACEQLGRKCCAIEISPAYVAVALQRWADATGKTPVKLEG